MTKFFQKKQLAGDVRKILVQVSVFFCQGLPAFALSQIKIWCSEYRIATVTSDILCNSPPLQVLALVFIRKLLDFIFTKRELSWLDDLMPEWKKKKLEDAEEEVVVPGGGSIP